MRIKKIMLCALLALAAGCAHDEGDDHVVATAMTPAGGPVRHLDFALTEIRRTDGPLVVEGYTVERSGEGVILISRGMPNRENVSGIDAGMVTANITTRLASDPKLRGIPIQVQADDTGLVRLDGRVPSVTQAQCAIEDAFAIPGVLAVESHLMY